MAKKVTKKVNPKEVFKGEIMAIIRESLEQLEIKVSDGLDYGMTKGTIIVHGENCDLQLKPITPKSGIDRYEIEEEEETEE